MYLFTIDIINDMRNFRRVQILLQLHSNHMVIEHLKKPTKLLQPYFAHDRYLVNQQLKTSSTT